MNIVVFATLALRASVMAWEGLGATAVLHQHRDILLQNVRFRSYAALTVPDSRDVSQRSDSQEDL